MQVTYDFYTENGTSGQSDRRHYEGKFMGNILGDKRDFIHAANSYILINLKRRVKHEINGVCLSFDE